MDFSQLESKISALVALVQKLKTEKEALSKEVTSLKKKITAMENDLLENNENLETLVGEKEKTKVVIADLIKNIDQLIETGK